MNDFLCIESCRERNCDSGSIGEPCWFLIGKQLGDVCRCGKYKTEYRIGAGLFCKQCYEKERDNL